MYMYHTFPPSRFIKKKLSPIRRSYTLEPTVLTVSCSNSVISFEENLVFYGGNFLKTFCALRSRFLFCEEQATMLDFSTVQTFARLAHLPLFLFFAPLSEPGFSGWERQNLAFQTNKQTRFERTRNVSSMIYHEVML